MEILAEISDYSMTDPSDISSTLIRLQNIIDCQFLQGYSQADNENFLSKFWEFILKVSSEQNASIRISSYRTMSMLLLKITPYYPSLIQKTFFNCIGLIEIDSKNAQIVIAAFSFISNFISISFLNHILENSKILEIFTLIDSTFSDHIGPIIKNLNRINNKYLNKLLFLYMDKGVKTQDRHLILAVTEIIKHDPSFFMNELIKYLREHSTVKENLGLLSYLFSTIQCDFKTIDFKDLIEYSIDILQNHQNATANEVDSALQILSLDEGPFKVVIETESENTLNININSESYNYDLQIGISDFSVRPSFYLLPLPLELLDISPNDGVLQMTSKFKTLAKAANQETDKEVKLSILEKFSSVLSKSYNDLTSPCLQGLALCLPTFLDLIDCSKILVLLNIVVFGPRQSWFHINDILNVIDAIPYKFFNFFNDGKSNIIDAKPIIDVLIDFSRNSNEKLAKAAENTIAKIINFTDFVQGTYYLSKKIDFFDITSLHHLLSIFNSVLKMRVNIEKSDKSNKESDKISMKHLNFFILQLIEAYSLHESDISLFKEVIHFMSYFDLHFVDNQTLKKFCSTSQILVEKSIAVIKGLKTEGDQASSEKSNLIYNYIAEEFSSLNFETVPETKLNFTHFLPSFSVAFRFMYALPHKFLLRKKNLVLNLFKWSMNFFYYRTAKLAERYWNSRIDFTPINTDFLVAVRPTLDFIQDHQTIALYCRLFLSIIMKNQGNQLNGQLEEFAASLHTVVRDEIDNGFYYDEFYALEILKIKRPEDVHPMKSKISLLDECQQLSLYKFLSFYENDLKLIEKVDVSSFDKISDKLDSIQTKDGALEKKPQEPKMAVNYAIDSKQDTEIQGETKDNKAIADSANSSGRTVSKADLPSVKAQGKRPPLPPAPAKEPKFKRRERKREEIPKPNPPSSSSHSTLDIENIQINNSKKAKQKLLMRRSSSLEQMSQTAKKGKPSQKKLTKSDDYESTDEINEYDYSYSSSETFTTESITPLKKLPISGNDIKFIHPITKDYLSSNIVESDPLNSVIKTQLKMDTYQFNKSQLELLFESYLEKNDSSSIIALLRYAKDKNILLSLPIDLIPNDLVPAILDYLNCLTSPEVESFLSKIDESPKTSQIKLAKFTISPSKSFEEFRKSPHITKNELKEFISMVHLCNEKELVEFVIKEMKEAKSKKRLDYVLAMSYVIFSFVKVTKEEVESIIQIINDQDKIIPWQPLSQLVLILARQIESNDDFIKFIKNSYSKCQGKSCGLIRLHQAMIASTNSRLTENISNISSPYIESGLPSIFCSGVRYFQQVLKNLHESEVVPLLKSNLSKLLKNFRKKMNIFPVAKIASESFSSILSKEALKQFHNELINQSSELIPDNKNAAFDDLLLCLPRFVSVSNENFNEPLISLEMQCDQLLIQPASLPFFKVYIETLRERVEKAFKNSTQKEDIVSDFITQWMQQCKDYDCYSMANIIFEWENFIFHFYGLEQLLNYACYQFIKYIPRFFPLFVGMSKFLRQKYDEGSDEDKQMIVEYLQNSALINPIRAHALCTLLMVDKRYSSTALKLACFPNDCKESDDIIESNNDFVQLLNTIKSNA